MRKFVLVHEANFQFHVGLSQFIKIYNIHSWKRNVDTFEAPIVQEYEKQAEAEVVPSSS